MTRGSAMNLISGFLAAAGFPEKNRHAAANRNKKKFRFINASVELIDRARWLFLGCWFAPPRCQANLGSAVTIRSVGPCARAHPEESCGNRRNSLLTYGTAIVILTGFQMCL